MEKKMIKVIEVVAGIVLFVVLFILAGRSDYEDAVVVEMKNNGTYWRLSKQYPEATDGELVKMYKADK